MAIRDDVLQAVYAAIDEFNMESQHGRLSKGEDTVLYGDGAKIDSLGLVTLIVSVEETLADRLGQAVTIVDEKAMSRRRSPFQSVGTLTDFVVERITGEEPSVED